MWTHFSLSRVLNSFMSMRSAMVSLREWEVGRLEVI